MNIIPTGSLSLDFALGTGGIPRGWITEIFGPPSSGKTTLVLHILAQAQRLGLRCVFMDIENGLNPPYAAICGVKTDQVLLASPRNGNEAWELAHLMLDSHHIDLIVMDTLAALGPGDDLEKGFDPAYHSDLNALLSLHLRKMNKLCRAKGGTLVCTNQMRKRIKKGYGTPETTPGGLPIKYHAAVRIALGIREYIYRDGQIRGVRITAKINKNRFNHIKHSATMEIVYNTGIDKERELFSLGTKQNIITRKGSQYYFQDQALGQGQFEAEKFLRGRGKVAEELEEEIRLSLPPSSGSSLPS